MSHKKLLLLPLLLLGWVKPVQAQKKYAEKAYTKNPYWIEMMEDTLSNYLEIQKAYDLYFSKHELPLEEDDIIGMRSATEEQKASKGSWLRQLFGGRRILDEAQLAFAVKRYKHWKILTEPWVQEDGSILYPYQRLQILNSIRR